MHVKTGVQMFRTTGFRQVTPADRVLGSTRRRPLYRNTYKPPMLASASNARLGGFWQDLRFSVGTAAVGGGALLLAGVLPSPAKTFAQITGVGLLAFAVINIATGKAEATDEPEEQRREIPVAEPADFQAVSATILEPCRPVGRGWTKRSKSSIYHG